VAEEQEVSPALIKKWIAADFKQLRLDADKTTGDVGDRLGKAKSWASQVELGRYLPGAAEMEILLDWYGKPELFPKYRALLKQAKRQKTQHAWPDSIPSWSELYLDLEAGAEKLSGWDNYVIHGIFQTEKYAENIIRSSRSWTEAEVRSRVQLRLSRQAVLTNEYPQVITRILDESALFREVGNADVMAEQLQHLIGVAEIPKITLQILPMKSRVLAGVEGSFTIVDLPEIFTDDIGTVYTETHGRGVYFEDATDVTGYRDAFTRLKAAALSPADSIELIKHAKENYDAQ
jgi:transcriptional regulator with XRE-family HTH domain